MKREDVLKVVTHTGDVYKITSRLRAKPFNFYVSRITNHVLIQDTSTPDDIPYDVVSFSEIVSVEAF